MNDLFEDRQGNIWICTRNDGIYFLPKKGRESKTIAINEHITKDDITALVQDKKGRIWFANKNLELKVLNKNKQNPLFQNKIHLRSQELWDRCSFESSLRYSNHGRVYERVLMTDIKTALAPRTREVMNTILTATNNIDEVDRLNRTGLHYAAIFGDLTVASVLLQNGADSYRKDKLNNTAEFYAHSQGYADVYKLLSRKY